MPQPAKADRPGIAGVPAPGARVPDKAHCIFPTRRFRGEPRVPGRLARRAAVARRRWPSASCGSSAGRSAGARSWRRPSRCSPAKPSPGVTAEDRRAEGRGPAGTGPSAPGAGGRLRGARRL